jgi:NAD(P)-dependent dehydrogenase (short-subunit alcohol dehydrogenase family)
MTLPQAPSLRLDGRRALITGAGRGIGLALATALAQAGAQVWLADKAEGEVRAVAEEIRNTGARAEALILDIMDVPLVERTLLALPAFDILVNNAGTNRPNPMESVSIDDYDLVFGLNVRAAFFISKAVAKRLLAERRGGSIINISSQMGHVGAVNRTLYCASKHAIEGLTKAMAVELGPFGIRANSIAPTFMKTPMTAPFFEADPNFEAQVLSKIKLGRLAVPEDLMGGVVFLASDAAAMVTGTSLVVDGGWTAD